MRTPCRLTCWSTVLWLCGFYYGSTNPERIHAGAQLRAKKSSGNLLGSLQTCYLQSHSLPPLFVSFFLPLSLQCVYLLKLSCQGWWFNFLWDRHTNTPERRRQTEGDRLKQQKLSKAEWKEERHKIKRVNKKSVVETSFRSPFSPV